MCTCCHFCRGESPKPNPGFFIRLTHFKNPFSWVLSSHSTVHWMSRFFKLLSPISFFRIKPIWRPRLTSRPFEYCHSWTLRNIYQTPLDTVGPSNVLKHPCMSNTKLNLKRVVFVFVLKHPRNVLIRTVLSSSHSVLLVSLCWSSVAEDVSKQSKELHLCLCLCLD